MFKIDDPQNHVGIETDDKVGTVFGRRVSRLTKAITVLATVAIAIVYFGGPGQTQNEHSRVSGEWLDQQPIATALPVLEEGKLIFRFDTFGDEAFWGDTLKLHRAIEGTNFGGVGAGVSPKTALAVGLKVDIDALPAELVSKIKQGRVNLDDPAVTLALIKLNSVLGIWGSSIRTAV